MIFMVITSGDRRARGRPCRLGDQSEARREEAEKQREEAGRKAGSKRPEKDSHSHPQSL